MPRAARQESSTGLYHIVMRGNNRNWIFKKPKNKQELAKQIRFLQARGFTSEQIKTVIKF